MTAEFYLLADSFRYNADSTLIEIEEKTKSLAEDFRYIKKYKETNKLFVHPEIYDVNFLEGIVLLDLLYNEEVANQHLDRDVRVSLKQIIIENETSPYTSAEVKEVLLPAHDENLCYGLIAFNVLEDVAPEHQVVYNLTGWLDFRRYYLGLYPKNATFYIDESIKYFPNLYFHERNKQTITAILTDCPKKIVYHLTALNDKFKQFYVQPYNRVNALAQFSAAANLDETASPEGNAARKKYFTFEFMNNDHEPEEVCCEPHLKLCHNDQYPGDQSYSNDRRIYFHEGKSNIENGKILIGHIGGHL